MGNAKEIAITEKAIARELEALGETPSLN